MIEKIKSLFKVPVYTIIDYDDKYYLVEAGPKNHTEMYGIDKNTFKKSSYSIGMDIDNFYDALENRTIYKSR
jgi:hypothetical protein